ncbi:hypothetical protein ABN028_05230 [Actinopolymorpha sp. B17G11]|uniref:hypothetical protein n=1 Tax=unclassified Actinopolymorpha TaxID=2627063 RepID=UPI0032D8F667
MSKRIRLLGGALALLAVGLITPSIANAAEEPRSGSEAAGVTASAATRSKLHELVTPGRKGFFYSANPTEVRRAVSNGFRKTDRNLGYVRVKSAAGVLKLYRLRYKAKSSYIITASPTERHRLASSGKFVYEGVVGHVSKTAGSSRFQIFRVSRNGSWRVTNRTLARQLRQQGWHVDGSLGFISKTR